jgi:hypothetical protein
MSHIPILEFFVSHFNSADRVLRSDGLALGNPLRKIGTVNKFSPCAEVPTRKELAAHGQLVSTAVHLNPLAGIYPVNLTMVLPLRMSYITARSAARSLNFLDIG